MTMDRDPFDSALRRYFVSETPRDFRPPVWKMPPTSPPTVVASSESYVGRATLALSLLALAAVGTVLLVKPTGRIPPAPQGGDLLKTATADGSKIGLPPQRPSPNP